MIHYLLLPGLGNSSEEHWQTYFENTLPNCTRIIQEDWENPICTDWIETIETYVQKLKSDNIVIITHSLGCIALCHWALKYGNGIKAAFMVAPPDIENPYKPVKLETFCPIPLVPLPFPALVISSSNDPWACEEKVEIWAQNWKTDIHSIGNAGHINIESKHGKWPEGLELLHKFMQKHNL